MAGTATVRLSVFLHSDSDTAAISSLKLSANLSSLEILISEDEGESEEEARVSA